MSDDGVLQVVAANPALYGWKIKRFDRRPRRTGFVDLERVFKNMKNDRSPVADGLRRS